MSQQYAPGQATSVPGPVRQEALETLDDLLASCAALRAELRGYEATIRRTRAHLAGDQPAPAIQQFNIPATRTGLSGRLDALERARHRSRITMFRLQLAEGMTIGQVARAWGLSRQLVSRTLRTSSAHADHPSRRT